MSTTTTVDVVGTARDRVDGRLKVTVAATYPIDVTLPGLAHAALVQSTITSGRIRDIAVDAAERAPGVLAVFTHMNTPPIAPGPVLENGPQPLPPFQSDAVLHYGQHVAMVVAETREQANAAAALIEVTYERDTPVLAYDDERATRVSHPWTPDYDRGDVASALAAADVRINQTYTTAANSNNPIGLFATVAVWDGDALTVHDTTQYPHAVRDTLAAVFGIDPAGVRVLVPFVGGAFGAGLRVWPHVQLVAIAARITKRPVKLVLTRAQMFTSIGHRPNTIQQLSIGASRDGQLSAIEHLSKSSIGMADELINLITHGTPTAYACPNVSTRARQIRQSIPIPGWMRAPGEAEGSFALESAIAELSYALKIDPIELRVKNHAHVHPDTGLPWSGNALLDCYRQGTERFGWSARNPEPRSMRNEGQLVGYGMGRGALMAYQPPCKAIASIRRDGTACVRSGATDIGPGPYTVMTMVAADCLGVPIERVRFGLGDSAMPRAPHEGGSGLTGALGNAVHAACVSLVHAFVNLVSDDEASPLKGCRLEGITVRNGGIQITDDPARFETYADILTRHDLDELTIEGESAPPGETSSATMIVQAGRFIPYTAPSTGTRAHAGGYAAHFVEVQVDPDLGTIRVARVVSAIDGGRILNPKTARSQIIGGIAMGIGMALLEETVSDRTGRLVTTSLAEYVVPVNADVRDVDVLFVGQPDAMTPLGTKGIGELAITGMAAAIANAVYHATGTRVRSLPISIEKVLGLQPGQ
ncbi:MAG: xanthine dehydrogenase family protein molybdopterin-binding subunit [Pyrinomonadaceae bacterium]|nr:xanthine dehydrogenase family protein molybdopterin-binding subunit [Pyrinomonadaceae bacterium]